MTTTLDTSREYVRTQVRTFLTSRLLRLLLDQSFQLSYLKQVSANRAVLGLAKDSDVVALMDVTIEEVEAELDCRMPIPATEH